MAEILIIEDEVKLRQELEVYLNNNGYLTKVIESFENTLEQMNQFDGDLILLDINLPNVNGQF
ncbi:response regulator, partial [[Ruminococcus] gnavus]